MMVGSKSSNQRPDTLMQDRIYWIVEIFLQRTAGPYIRVKSADGRAGLIFPVYPLEPTI